MPFYRVLAHAGTVGGFAGCMVNKARKPIVGNIGSGLIKGERTIAIY
jgi:hypothetical protein